MVAASCFAVCLCLTGCMVQLDFTSLRFLQRSVEMPRILRLLFVNNDWLLLLLLLFLGMLHRLSGHILQS